MPAIPTGGMGAQSKDMAYSKTSPRAMGMCVALPSMPRKNTASVAGARWAEHLEQINALLAIDGWDEGVAWIADRADLVADGYFFSKECVQVYRPSGPPEPAGQFPQLQKAGQRQGRTW